MKKLNNFELKQWNMVLFILTFVFLFTTVILLTLNYVNQENTDDNFSIPKQYSGVWLSLNEPRVAVVVFDLTDSDQAQVAKQVDSFFKERNTQTRTLS